MKNIEFLVGVVLALFYFLVSSAFSQEHVPAPVYRDGDWWRVKFETWRPTGISVSGACSEAYGEYLVKIDGGEPKVFGIKGDQPEEIDCPSIVSQVLGITKSGDILLKFPMRLGLAWSGNFYRSIAGLRGAWVDAQYEVQSWEKITTPKGTFEAYKIVKTITGRQFTGPGPSSPQIWTYYYSPQLKAIIYYGTEAATFKGTSTLVDFNVSQ